MSGARTTRLAGGRSHGTGAGRVFAGLAILALLVPRGADGQRACDAERGTLGIQGMRCEGCSFRMSESGLEEARFRTEPEIVAIVRGTTGGDRLRAGDRIVAIDGALITTAEGSRRLVGLRNRQPVAIRVRRDGEVETLRLVAGSACELRARREGGELEVERLEETGIHVAPRPPVPPAPPAAPGAPALPPLPPLPAAPEPPSLGPSGYLGFGIRCSRCGWRDGDMFFSSPPVIEGVAGGGPAQRAGLRSGDAIVEVDGVDITTGDGGRRFGTIEPGQRVRLTVRREDATRGVTVVATERPARRAPSVLPGAGGPVRYEGNLGETRIEVRGAPVRVTRDEGTGELVIRTSDTVIILRGG